LRGAELKNIGLPNGKWVDVHLFTGPRAVHVLLLDVRTTVEQTRAWQQSAQETELRSYEKTRQLRVQKASVTDLREANYQLRFALELERAKTAQLRHELFAQLGRGLEGFAHAFDRHSALGTIASTQASSLLLVAQSLSEMLAGQMSMQLKSDPTRALYVDPARSASALLPALMFAHRRTAVATPMLSAQLSFESDTLKLSVFCGKADLSAEEVGVLWESHLPERDLNPPESALLLLAERLRETGGRVTRQFAPEPGLQLLISVSTAAPRALPSVTRSGPSAIGKTVLLVSTDAVLSELLAAALSSSGVSFAPCMPAEFLSQATTNQPNWVLLDLHVPDANKLAFSLKAGGYAGKLIGVGEFKGSAAVRSAFDALLTSASSQSLREAILV
jgi:hypothetical protein